MQLGRLAVVDAILNNYDRIPAAHVNAGNVENVLVSSTGVVHPIDQVGQPFSTGTPLVYPACPPGFLARYSHPARNLSIA